MPCQNLLPDANQTWDRVASRRRRRKAASTTGALSNTNAPCSSYNMETDSVLHQQLPSAYRSLQPQAAQAIQHGHGHGHGHAQHNLTHHTLASSHGLDLSGLDDHDHVFHQDLRLQDPTGHAFQSPNPFDRG